MLSLYGVTYVSAGDVGLSSAIAVYPVEALNDGPSPAFCIAPLECSSSRNQYVGLVLDIFAGVPSL